MISDLAFRDASVDSLYISHMLHHLYRTDASKLLGKAIRTRSNPTVQSESWSLTSNTSCLFTNRGSASEHYSYFFYESSPSQLFTRRYQYDFCCFVAAAVSGIS